MQARRLRLAVLPLALLCAFAGRAQDGEPGWYLGGGIRPVTPEAEDTDIGYRNFGGYRFTRHWGVELGYSDLGRGNGNGHGGMEQGGYSVEKYGYQTSAWTLAGTGVLPIGESFSLLGRLGWSLATPDSTMAGFSLGTATPAFGMSTAMPRYRGSVLWGFGGQYDLTDRVGLRVDYNNFGRLEDQSRSDLWSVNAVVRF